jgi:hypothetical protein
MALLHDATLTPTKRELLAAWLPTRTWFDGAPDRDPVASFRLDDPEGEVGMEGFLLGSEPGSTLFVPLTYRGAPLDDDEQHLVGTTEHSVLGRRWVYDACADPVWVSTVATTIRTGGGEAELEIEVDGVMQTRSSTASVRGSGAAEPGAAPVGRVTCHDDGGLTHVTAGEIELVVVRVVGASVEAAETLTGDWGWGSGVLAGLR